MFSTLGLFRHIPCPAAGDCSFDICLFSHDTQSKSRAGSEQPPLKKQKLMPLNRQTVLSGNRDVSNFNAFSVLMQDDSGDEEPKQTADVQENVPAASEAKLERRQGKPNLDGIDKSGLRRPRGEGSSSVTASSHSSTATAKHARTNLRVTEPASASKKELLQPRNMAHPPATHPVRFKLLLLVHEQLARLNKLVIGSADKSKDTLALSDDDLVRIALDEEHGNAVSNPKVYTNVMKNRIGTLKKTDLKTWIAERSAELKQRSEEENKSQQRKPPTNNERVKTDVSYNQEIQLLSQFVASTATLEKHGYVTSVPADAELIKAEAGVKAANGWEICDRCGCRFRAHPTRQEDGTITTGGSCRHHWGRLGPQPRATGAKPIYSCCKLEQGQPGCEEKPSHVFKVSNPQRLATVLQFECTPETGSDENKEPVSFDCEMAYTSYGMELIRLTVAKWPAGEAILDVLVRPKGEVLDLNTRFSGVSIKQWTEAKLWDSVSLPQLPTTDDGNLSLRRTTPDDAAASQPDETQALPIVPSPEHARSLLFKLISPSTPLIGHALENDLIAVRIVHPTIVDTVILYPHKRGLPMKNKLKFLVRDEIQWTIQEGGSDGHDSLEDALAAGELVRHKVRVKWEVLQRAGWSFDGDELHEPVVQK